MKKICIVTGSRAEYGLLRWVMEGIKKSSKLDLQIVATGMHLSSKFGSTVNEIEKDGFYIDQRVDMQIDSDTPNGVTKSLGYGVIGFGNALDILKPDLLLVLGDRYEIFSASSAAMIARIPIAHLHGGEATEGLIDEPIRHSITKMSHLHFVATEEYKNRVIQLGEDPNRVFLVGGLGIDSINRLELMSKDDLEKSLNFKFKSKNLLITFHPVTLEKNSSKNQIQQLLMALDSLNDTQLIFTMPNSDTDGSIIFDLINSFVADHNNSCSFISMGQLRYLSSLNQVDAVVGNSSSGLIEAPSFRIGTINIGDRQRGRLKASSVIDCQPDSEAIKDSIKNIYSSEFQDKLRSVKNPYGEGGASSSIVKIIEETNLDNLIMKKFHDILKR
tara:strand:- start:3254 stop:4414 length:1161 start_codon:yes stop_codon:yes gene_type:complete